MKGCTNWEAPFKNIPRRKRVTICTIATTSTHLYCFGTSARILRYALRPPLTDVVISDNIVPETSRATKRCPHGHDPFPGSRQP
jgi:hypothetical protein